MIQTVVHYVDSDTFGGCEEVILILLSGLDKRYWRPILFHHEAPGIARLLDEASRLGIPTRSVRPINNRNIGVALSQFTSALRLANPAIFHIHLNWPLGCRYALTAAMASRVPSVVATSHLCSPVSGVRFAWLRKRLRNAAIDRYIAVSQGTSDCLQRNVGVPASQIRVVHNGIRVKSFDRSTNAALRASLTEGIDRPIIFTPARLHAQKGHRYLLGAAALVPHALFVLAGDGEERERLEQQAKTLGIENRVRFLGDRKDVPDLLACCDVFVLPSLYEGLPLAVLEAMAAAKPIVATAIAGTDEAVIHGTTGLLVPPRSPADLADAIRGLLAEPARAARLAEAAKSRITEHFSSEEMVRGTTQLYDELVSARQTSTKVS